MVKKPELATPAEVQAATEHFKRLKPLSEMTRAELLEEGRKLREFDGESLLDRIEEKLWIHE